MSETSIDTLKADIAELEAQIKDKKAELRALRPTKAKAEPKLCADGCGQMTRGGLFLPGHDAKLRGQLLSAIRAGGPAEPRRSPTGSRTTPRSRRFSTGL